MEKEQRSGTNKNVFFLNRNVSVQCDSLAMVVIQSLPEGIWQCMGNCSGVSASLPVGSLHRCLIIIIVCGLALSKCHSHGTDRLNAILFPVLEGLSNDGIWKEARCRRSTFKVNVQWF